MKTIGLLTFKKSPLEQVPPIRQRALLAETTLQGAEFVLMEATSPNIQDNLIQAYVWSIMDGWTPKIINFPDVVIIVGSSINKQQALIEREIRKKCTIVADVGINKLRAYHTFQNTSIKKHLIHTSEIPKTNIQEFIQETLNNNPAGIVIKRANSNQGVGLLFVVDTGSNYYVVKHNNDIYCGTLSKISEYIEKKIAGRIKYRDYIYQRYVRSITIDNRSYDIRIHVQKRKDNQWHVTRSYVRLSEANSLLPNTSRGGYQGCLYSFLENNGFKSAKELIEKIHNTALKIAKTQDHHTNLPLSELGIDLLLENNDIMLIETNALPQSSMHEYERAIYTIEYALSLIQ